METPLASRVRSAIMPYADFSTYLDCMFILCVALKDIGQEDSMFVEIVIRFGIVLLF